MTRKQMVLLQPHLVSLDGHEHTQFKALEWLLPQHRLTVVTRQGCALAEHLHDTQLLQLLPRPLRKRRLRKASHSDAGDRLAYRTALKQALATTQASPSDLLLVPSTGPDEITALVDFLEHVETGVCPPVLLRILSEDVVSRLDGRICEKLRRLSEQGRMVLYTETTELCARIRQQHRLPVRGAFYLPCTILPGSVAKEPHTRPNGKEVRIGVLGRQRSEKGSYRIPAILYHLRQLAAQSAGNTKICIVYQAVRSKRFRRFVLEARTRLGAGQNPGVRIEFLDSGMTGPDFRQLLLDMDVLLLPYDTRRYQYSGSGIIMDAVVAQKPIVHARGMAMKGLLSHGNGEAAGTDREFAEKLLQVATHLPRYQSGTRSALTELETLFGETARSLTGNQAEVVG